MSVIALSESRADFKSTIFFPSFNISDGADNVSVVLAQRCC